MRPIICIVLIIFISHLVTAQEQDKRDYSIKITSPQIEYSAGSEIKIVIKLTNTSDHDLTIHKEKAPLKGEFDYTVGVENSQRQRPGKTKYYRIVSREEATDTTVLVDSGFPVILKPGESATEEV